MKRLRGNRARPVRADSVQSSFVEKLESRVLMSRVPVVRPASLSVAPAPAPARQAELLDRGVIALLKSAGNVYVSWRMLGTDPADIAFNLYRSTNGGAPIKLNNSPITNTTDFNNSGVDTTKSNAYFVKPVANGIEGAASESYTLPANVATRQYIPIPLSPPPGGNNPATANTSAHSYTYNANDASVGDVDGDGQYEIILKWDPSDSKDNSQEGYTGNVYFDCYKLDGTRLWRINMGRNIRAGAHYSPFLVYDFNGDGKSEFVLRTAPGTIDGRGNAVLLPGDSVNADYRNSAGYVLTGPEYLTVFNGATGAAMASIPFSPARGSVTQWGDSYGNRVDRFLASVAYLDGVHPSIVMSRGYYGPQSSSGQARNEIAAYDWRNGQLTQRWLFKAGYNINNNINSNYIAQGTHSMTIGDVDGDGKDEIIYGSATINDDGTGLYSTGLGHGDALMMSDMDPSHPGLEVFQVHEDTGGNGHIGGSLRDAATGAILQSQPVSQGTDGSWPDIGRGNAFDIDPNHAGFEFWSSADGNIHGVDGAIIQAKPSNMFTNFGIWWDADPLRELLDGTTISDWRITSGVGGRSNLVSSGNSGINSSAGLSSNNGTKSTPCLVADMFGDWREEVIWRKSDNTELQIWSTTITATTRMPTLMHDIQYRESVAFQNSGYNQPTQTSFFLGAANAAGAFPAIPTPNIYTVAADLTPPTVQSAEFQYETVQKLVLKFSEPIDPGTLSEADLNLHPQSYEGPDLPAYSHSYDAATMTATFYLWGSLPDGNYRATLLSGSVSDMSSNPLASAYTYDFFFLAGDANHDRSVNINDFSIMMLNWQQSGTTFSQGDFNYDQQVDSADLTILSSRWQYTLNEQPPTTPTSLPLLTPTPTRTARRIINLI